MSDNEKTLYVSDLDGTLLNADSRISPATARMLNDVIAEGALVSIASARTPATVAPIMKNIDLRIPAVVMTGACLWNPADGKFSRRKSIPADVAARVADVFSRHRIPTFAYSMSDSKITFYHFGPQSDLEKRFIAEREGNPYKHFEDRLCSPDGWPLTFDDTILFYSLQPDEILLPAYEELKKFPELNVLYYSDIFGSQMEIFDASVNKADAVSELARQVGASRIVAFGDNVNDIPMMERADVAVAVGNAIDDVKRRADVIIGPNIDDSVPRFIIDDFNIHK